jgi:hypothetical protein
MATYRGAPPRSDGLNRWFLFRRRFDLAATPESATIDITVDGRYLLFVNGVPIGRGPARCSPLFQRYDSYDLAPRLQPGANALAVLIHTYGVDTSFYEMVKGMWQPTFGDGALWVQGVVRLADREVDLSTAAEWRCTQSQAWRADTPRCNESLGFIEALDARGLPADWTDAHFDDAGWDTARPLVAGGGGPEANFGGLETRPFPVLIERGVPPLEERLVPARRIVWIKGQRPEPELALHERAYVERLLPLPAGAVEAPEHLLRPRDGATVVRTPAGCDISILVDFGSILSAHPRIEIDAKGGETVELAACEHLTGEWEEGGLALDARIERRPGFGLETHLCVYTARPGVQVFERFEWCAVRWLQLTVRNAREGLTIRGLGALHSTYPVERRGRFSSSDPFLDRLWQVGANTLRQCMHDAWEDCPSREQRQWLGDATVENLVGHAAFGPCVAPLNAKFLLQAAESQRPDGLTQMFAPGDHHENGLLIPDWTLQWILNAGDHYAYTGDRETIAAILPSILKALDWFGRLRGPSGLVQNLPYWHFIDWAGVGRHGEPATLNAQYAGALAVAATLCLSLGWREKADALSGDAERIAMALDQRHWDERRGVYVDTVDPVSARQEARVSQHANASIALWSARSQDRVKRALDRIVDPQRLTFVPGAPVVPKSETLDPEEGVVLANTFYSHFVYDALNRRGRASDALALMRGRFGPMLAKGATTLWESFGPTASLCHAFSASPTWQMSRHLLGVAPGAPGFARIAITPQLAELGQAEGVVPTRVGDVTLRLSRTPTGFQAEIANADAPADVHTAPGLRRVSGPDRLAPGESAKIEFERV